MSTIRILAGGPQGGGGSKHPPHHKPHHHHDRHMTFRTLHSHKRIHVQYAPGAWTGTGLAATYLRVNRPGRADELDRQFEPTPVIAMQITFAKPDYYETDVQTDIDDLRGMADQSEPVVVGGYGTIVGPYAITSLEVDVTELMPGTNRAARATAQIELTRLIGVQIPSGPTHGGAKHPKKPKHIPATYTVKKGDTLPKIALKILGDAAKWREIATLNHIRHPKKIKVGEKLKMPRS